MVLTCMAQILALCKRGGVKVGVAEVGVRVGVGL